MQNSRFAGIQKTESRIKNEILTQIQVCVLLDVILCAAENLRIDEQDCGLDFFAPTDR